MSASALRRFAVVPLLLVGVMLAAPLAAQPRDTLRLPALLAAARAADPRARQLDLTAAQSALRLESLGAERLPTLTGEGSAMYQSAVPRVPASGALPFVPTPPHDTYDAHVVAQLRVLDPSRAPRRAVERAQLVESQAQIRSTLFALRAEVNDAFFAAATLDARRAELDATLGGLAARLREAIARVRGGTALPSDTAAVAATLLQRRQDVLQVEADRDAALARLAALTDSAIDATAIVALPDLATAVAAARVGIDSLRARPEFAQFAATRDRLARQSTVDAARERPQLSLFGRAGYGRPGLNPLATSFDTYWLGGVQVQWTPWTWGTVGRDREIVALQREIVESSEAAFARQLRRAADADLAAVDRLAGTLALDDSIVALRGGIERESRARLGEGVVTGAEYADRETELLAARLSRASHRVALAQARARFLTTLGIEIP